jgi:hypothetical protein
MATQYYSESDVARWKSVGPRSFALLADLIRAGDMQRGRRYSQLALSLKDLALTAAAAGEAPMALGYYVLAARALAKIRAMFLAGGDVDAELLEASAYEPLLLAHLSGDEASISAAADQYAQCARRGVFPTATLAIGELVQRLTNAGPGSGPAVDGVRVASSSVRSDLFAMATAIEARDQSAFRSALAASVKAWQRTVAAERLRGLPESVYHQEGLAFVKLARRYWAIDFPVDVPFIPVELIRAVAVPIDVDLTGVL